MGTKNKGKIHPSPTSSHSLHTNKDSSLSVLSFLPSTILTLISLLSLQEKQTLAYMITRSLNPHTNITKKTKLSPHKSPNFDCDCFECYTSYWHKWDTSPNREIIHQAIEAFEEREEKQKKRGKRREKAKPVSENVEKVESFDAGLPKNVEKVVAGDDDVAPPARKVLPDVVGMIGSRLWSLWNPGDGEN